jgi:selenocysteine-specific elongation factor
MSPERETPTHNEKLRVMGKYITVGVAGHMDHGKTSLARCLTGMDTDRLKEEKRRGLSIEPSVAPLQLPSGGRIALVDVPGHSDFLKNTIRGLSNVDMAVLVVAADDGVMPQTKDHLEALNFFRAKGGLIGLSKADIVDHETLELAEMEIREILDGSFLQGKPVIPFSAANGRGLDQILEAVEKEVRRVVGKTLRAPFRLWIDQVRSFPGYGTVVSGTVLAGIIRRDDTVQLLPSGKEAKVRFVEVHHQRVDRAVAGQRVGLNLPCTSLQEVRLGTVLAAPGVLSPTSLLNSELSLLPNVRRPILNRQRVKLYIGTQCTTTLLVMMENERLHPGETGLVQLRLQEPLAVLPRDPFVISPMNLPTVIGGGKILETPREKFRATKAEKTLAYLEALRREDLKSSIKLYFSKFCSRPVTVEEVASATGFPVERVQAAIKSRIRSGKTLYLDRRGYFDRARYELLKSQLVAVTKKIISKDAFKLAASVDEIRFQLDRILDDAPFERMLCELCKERKLVATEAGYRIPNFAVRFPGQWEKLVGMVVEFATNQGYETFSAGTFRSLHREAFALGDIENVLDHLRAQKKLVRLNDDRFLAAEALQEIKEKVRELILRKGSLGIQDCREIFGYGRTRAIPVLEYLDTIGLTRRIGDVRVLSRMTTSISNRGRCDPARLEDHSTSVGGEGPLTRNPISYPRLSSLPATGACTPRKSGN